MGIAAAGVLALYLAFGAYQIYDYDLPLHLITGEYLLRDPSSAGREIFAFPFPDYEWLNDKWLENVVVYLVDAAAGAPGLVALRMALLAGLCFLTAGAMGSGLGLRGPPKPGQAVIAAAGLAFLPFVAYERFNLRPELFSLLLVAAVLWLASRDRRTRGEWIAIGVLHVVWVNLR